MVQTGTEAKRRIIKKRTTSGWYQGMLEYNVEVKGIIPTYILKDHKEPLKYVSGTDPHLHNAMSQIRLGQFVQITSIRRKMPDGKHEIKYEVEVLNTRTG